MKKRVRMLTEICFLVTACMLTGCVMGEATQPYTLRALNYGHTTTRISILEDTVEQYNAEHSGQRYALELNHYIDDTWNWNNNIKNIKKMLDEKQVDILTIPSTYIMGELAEEGYLLPLDDIVEQPEFEQEYFAPILAQTRVGDHAYGLLVETDVQMVYWNRDILEKLGYTSEEIDKIPEEVRKGNITLSDLENIGRQAVEQELCDFGIVHRPTYGVFFYMMAQQYQALSISEEEVMFDEARFTEMLQFFERITESNRAPMPNQWADNNDIFIQGRAAVYFGASWTIYDCVEERGADADRLSEQYVVSLFPAVEKGQTPFTSLAIVVAALSSKCEQAEAVKEILEAAYSNWDALAKHCAISYRLPISKSAVNSPAFQENEFLSSTMYMTDYASNLPCLPDNQRWLNTLHQAVLSVENGSGTPEDVAHSVALDMELEK